MVWIEGSSLSKLVNDGSSSSNVEFSSDKEVGCMLFGEGSSSSNVELSLLSEDEVLKFGVGLRKLKVLVNVIVGAFNVLT